MSDRLKIERVCPRCGLFVESEQHRRNHLFSCEGLRPATAPASRVRERPTPLVIVDDPPGVVDLERARRMLAWFDALEGRPL
jgi:hypothetical protein